MSTLPDHKRLIESLAQKSTVPIDEVTRLFEHEWAKLDTIARVKSFIAILTVRRVRELLRKSSIEAPQRASKDELTPNALGPIVTQQSQHLRIELPHRVVDAEAKLTGAR